MRLTRICVGALAVMSAWAGPVVSQEQSAASGVRVLRDLPYVEGGHEQQRLDLFLPAKAEGVLPLIVWVHGGGWEAEHKEERSVDWFVARGYAAASIDYRYSQIRHVSHARSTTARRPFAGCGRTPPSIISTRTASALRAIRPAATWSPCWAPPGA